MTKGNPITPAGPALFPRDAVALAWTIHEGSTGRPPPGRRDAITSSLQTLAAQADNIARGQLDEPLDSTGEDEVGQLRGAFEQMRLSLKQRLEELNQLLVVVQGVASNLEMSQAVEPVLDAALGSGASAARVVLDPKMVPELEGDSRNPVYFLLAAKERPIATWMIKSLV